MISTDRLCMGCMNDNGGEQICPICGFNSQDKNPKNAIPIRSVINDRFVVGRMIRANGEGISYIGWDTANDSIVEVREYFPEGLAKRNPDRTISIVKGNEYTFNEGLLEFLEINKAIKSSDLPSLVPVVDVFEENGTAFAVMQSVQGVTLGEFISQNGAPLKWEQARALFLPLIDTISGMHELGIVHGSISTDTIIVGRDGKLRLTGYSIKKLRYENPEVKFEINDGFAALEQYHINEELKVTASTDVYGFAATLFNVLIGTLPAKATERLKNDSMSIPSKFAEELPRQVLSSLANALQVKPGARTADMEAFKNQLVYGEIPGAAVKGEYMGGGDVKSKENKQKKQKESSGNGLIILLTTLVTIIIIGILAVVFFGEDLFGGANEVGSDIPSDNSSVVSKVESEVESYPDDVERLYTVPDLEGEYYSAALENPENEQFIFIIKGKEFSAYPRGTIITQSVAKGSQVKKETEIEVTISLGPKEFKMPSLIHLTRDQAILALLKAGFLYENIEFLEKYDEEFTPSQVIEQYPVAGEKVNADIGIKIYINTYEGEFEY